MHIKAKAIIQRLKLEKNSITVQIERIEKAYGERLAQNCWKWNGVNLHEHYLIIDNLSSH